MSKLTLKSYVLIKRQDLFVQRSNSKSLRESWVTFREMLMSNKNR